MIQYTTPTMGMRLENTALDLTDEVIMTFQPVDKNTKQPKGEPMDFTSPTVQVEGDDTVVSVKLTQEQSAALPVGLVKVMVNVYSTDGTRTATKRGAYFTVEPNLHPVLMPSVEPEPEPETPESNPENL